MRFKGAGAANFALLSGLSVIVLANFVLPKLPGGFDPIGLCGNSFYVYGVVFVALMAIMLLWSILAPRGW